MVYPGAPVESTSRSSLESQGIYQSPCSTPSLILPQQLVYTSYNAYCGLPQVQSTFDDRRNAVSNNHHFSLRAQDYRGLKSTKWHQKSRSRFKEYHQTHQQPIPFAPAPLVLYDPLQNHLTTPIPSINPVYLSQTTACYSQPLTTETYTTYNPTVLPQTYYKPTESQFCAIHDRQTPQLSYQPIQQTQQSPSNVAASHVKSRNYESSVGYSTSLRNIPRQVQSHSNFLNYAHNKIPISLSNRAHSEVLYPDKPSLLSDNQLNLNESLFEMTEDTSRISSESHKKSPKSDKYFDDPATFDFTIEAEKMVSSICNTASSHDLDKDEDATPRDGSWYIHDSSHNLPKTFKSTETQTSPSDDLHCPEILRKAIHSGCTEMESILKNSTPTYRKNWLLSLSSATRMALSKSSTCFPIYLSDKAFAQDLMNSFLRISNGWLALDNYLNKQPNLSLSQKFNKDLQKSFKIWESSTALLLDAITKNFKKLETSSEEQHENPSNTSSFPGDVSLYVNYNLFSNCQPVQTSAIVQTNRNVSYPIIQNNEDKQRWLSVARESKVRTKWTITENQKLKEFPTLPVPQFQNLIGPTEKTSIESTVSFWSPCITSSPTYTNLVYSDQNPIVISQIDSSKIENCSEGGAINLSAWFASMRRNETNSPITPNFFGPKPISHRETKSPYDVMGTLKMDPNRQLRTLKNMRMIQSAPWTANQILEDHSSKKSLEDNITEDERIYMKPGSYNVPKKKPSKRSTCRSDSSGSRAMGPQAGQVPKPPAAFLETAAKSNYSKTGDSSEKKTSTINSSSSSSTSSQDVQRDSTWKAACASAELLLDALNVEKKKSKKCKRDEYSSREDSGDEKDGCKIGDLKKTNVKTDSWLIRTLNNAKTSDSSDVKREWEKTSGGNHSDGPERSFSLETSHTFAVMTLVDVVGKATYSETVRRFSAASKPSTSKAGGKSGDIERMKREANSRVAEADDEKSENGKLMVKTDSEKMGKSKRGKGQTNDKGWSVWYSSRRKQQNNTLGPSALEKLMSIYRILWRMDATRIFKFPGGTSKDSESSDVTIENYRKVIKSPMFLETIGYKLKNHVYRKIDHVIKDFRKIVHNSKVYHRNDKNCTEKIEILSRKFEELVDQHFSDDPVVKSNTQTANPSIPTGSPKACDEKESGRRNIRNS